MSDKEDTKDMQDAIATKVAAATVQSAADILGSDDMTVERVFIPEWDKYVNVRTLSAQERDEFENSLTDEDGNTVLVNTRAKLAVLSVVNDEGARVFGPEHMAALGNKNAKAVDRIYKAAARLSGIGRQATEDAVKNSDGDHSGAQS